MSTVRRFNASCPDCGRWRCVCNFDGCPDCGEFAQPCACIRRESAEAYDSAMEVVRGPHGRYVIAGDTTDVDAMLARVGPPSPAIRAKLAALRDEFARGGRP